MEGNDIQLRDKLVGKIEGEFYIPSYQRGYRWDESQVRALLDDIYESEGKPYCLQPLVVRKDEDGRFEAIDGQQRLTTIFIIYKYMVDRWPDYIEDINYSLSYETRKENADFFNHINDEEKANLNIDFYFINKAYKTIDEWFNQERPKKPLHVAGKLTEYFDNSVKVIWYELQSASEAEAISLFTRLNIGRIPLTNAELIKALFLCRQDDDESDKQLEEKRQSEIALQWDTIERELHDDNFWYFLTRKQAKDYPTRIELLFDFMACKQEGEKDKYATFLWFSERREDLQELWTDINKYYYRLKEWYKKDSLYHKIGYLVASGFSTINLLMEKTSERRKSEMDMMLDDFIRESVDFKKPYADLTYENDYEAISRLLLLFNVASLMKSKSDDRFPFKEFNTNKWSLEHIHAQNSLKLNTQDKWREWLKHHIESVEGMRIMEGEALAPQILNDIQAVLALDKITEAQFNELSDRITRLLSKNDEPTEYIHSISNMALLQTSSNSVLSNGLFDAKRREIIRMDSEGIFIPYCTKMVFLKYYSSAQQDSVSFHFWAEDDRRDYIKRMNDLLFKDYGYLKEEIKL